MSSLQFVKEYRNMPFIKRGMRIEVDGQMGKVTSVILAVILMYCLMVRNILVIVIRNGKLDILTKLDK